MGLRRAHQRKREATVRLVPTGSLHGGQSARRATPASARDRSPTEASMIRETSQNLRPPERGEECPTLLAIRLKEAFDKAQARKRQPETQGP
jgi:hypothetical protein